MEASLARLPNLLVRSLRLQRQPLRCCCAHFCSETGENRKPQRRGFWVDTNDVLTIPNALTALRIAGTPFITWWIINDRFDLAIAGFAAASFLDFLDGFIARKFDQTSTFGSFLDPLADKILVTSTVVSMAYKGMLPMPLVALMVGRDVTLLGGGFAYRWWTKPPGVRFFATDDVGSIEAKPTLLGKACAASQFTLIGLALTNCVFEVPPAFVLDVGIYGVGTLTLLSGLSYMSGSAIRTKKKK